MSKDDATLRAVEWYFGIPENAVSEVRAVPRHDSSDPDHYEIVLHQRISSTHQLDDILARHKAVRQVEDFLKELGSGYRGLPEDLRRPIDELRKACQPPVSIK